MNVSIGTSIRPGMVVSNLYIVLYCKCIDRLK